MVLSALGPSTSSLTHLLEVWGYPIVALFVAIESAGAPIPGETMLFLAAAYAGAGHLRIFWVIVVAAAGAIVGDNLGYTAGRYGGRSLIERYGGYVRIRPEHLDRAEQFFNRYGDRMVFLGRFVPTLRSWIAFLAGMNRMTRPKFVLFNAAGGIVWATVYGLLGYFLGNNLPLLHRIVTVGGGAVAVVVVIVAVVAFVLWRRRKGQQATQSP